MVPQLQLLRSWFEVRITGPDARQGTVPQSPGRPHGSLGRIRITGSGRASILRAPRSGALLHSVSRIDRSRNSGEHLFDELRPRPLTLWSLQKPPGAVH